VTAAGVKSREPVAFSYSALSQPPRITGFFPTVGPASGATPVTIEGKAFGDAAVVTFVERDSHGAYTGNRSECVWQGVPSMVCTNTVIRCLSPPLVTAGRSFDIAVRVLAATVIFTDQRWTYEPPIMSGIVPNVLPPQPIPDGNITVHGRNFGGWPGSVAVGPRVLTCLVWTDSTIVCTQPPGVERSVNVTVTTASRLPSGFIANVTQLFFQPPTVTNVEPNLLTCGTEGGVVLNVAGANFGHPLPMSAWLVRRQGAPFLLEEGRGPHSPSDVLECMVLPETVVSHSLACMVPPGTGVGWALLVVNHDMDVDVETTTGALPSRRWRSSAAATNFSLAYASPVLSTVHFSGAQGAAPAVGGFLLRLVGTNFGPWVPVVSVGSLPCAVVPGTHNHSSLTCIAPPRQVDGDSVVRVSTESGPSSITMAIVYDAPSVLRVEPREVLAVAGAGGPRITLYGVNFGVAYRAGIEAPHNVSVGPLPCVFMVWASDAELSCMPQGETAVGPVNVTLSVAGDVATPVVVMAGCPRHWHGRVNDFCAPCPPGAGCTGGVTEPYSLPGFFPVARDVFVGCTPRRACAGGIGGSDLTARTKQDNAGCSSLYQGDRCATCAAGAYRRQAKCAKCPDTAWLLFLGYSLGVVSAVAAAVYLAGKRINMAGLSIGVVRWFAAFAC
jgi:hypothetical protein